MNTTTLISTGLATGLPLTAAIGPDGSIDQKPLCMALGITAASATTIFIGDREIEKGQREIYQKYTSAYVESMTDEELESALVKIGLLEEENSTITKTM